MILVHRSTIGSTLSAFSGREHRHDARDPRLCQARHPVKIVAEAERGDLGASSIADIAALLRRGVCDCPAGMSKGFGPDGSASYEVGS